MFQSLGEYEKAKEYLEKALAIKIQIGNKKGEGSWYGNLGSVFKSLGEHEKAKEYLEKALAIKIQIGDKEGEATDYITLGTVFKSLGEYEKAKEYLEKAPCHQNTNWRQRRRSQVVRKLRNCLSSPLVNMRKLKNILRKHLPSQYKLATKTEKPARTET